MCTSFYSYMGGLTAGIWGGGGGGRTRLLLALVIGPLTTHPFRGGGLNLGGEGGCEFSVVGRR